MGRDGRPAVDRSPPDVCRERLTTDERLARF